MLAMKSDDAETRNKKSRHAEILRKDEQERQLKTMIGQPKTEKRKEIGYTCDSDLIEQAFGFARGKWG